MFLKIGFEYFLDFLVVATLIIISVAEQAHAAKVLGDTHTQSRSGSEMSDLNVLGSPTDDAPAFIPLNDLTANFGRDITGDSRFMSLSHSIPPEASSALEES
jgi:hypothetical protein